MTNSNLWIYVWIVGGYLLGSIPIGFVLAKLRGIDIQQQGSGNIGATNVKRTLGAKAGLVTLLLDACKGLAVVLIAHTMALSLAAQAWIGVATVVGHCYSIWLRFRGGKGVATSLGVLIALQPIWALWAVVLFGLVYAVGRRVSLASIAATCSVLCMCWWQAAAHQGLSWAVTALVMLIVMRHRDNICRLSNNTEPTT